MHRGYWVRHPLEYLAYCQRVATYRRWLAKDNLDVDERRWLRAQERRLCCLGRSLTWMIGKIL